MQIRPKAAFGFGAVLVITAVVGMVGGNGMALYASGVTAEEEMLELQHRVDVVGSSPTLAG